MTLLRPILAFGILVMLVYFIWLAIREAKNTTSLFRFYLYGDDFKGRGFAGDLIATNAGLSGAFVLILYYGYQYGLWAFPFVWSFWLITQYASLFTIRRTEAVLKAHGGWDKNRATLHEFLGLVFSSPRSRLYGGILSCCAYLGLIAAEVVLAAHILDYVFPDSAKVGSTTLSWSPFLFILGVMLCILVYNVISGFRGTVQTDFAQWLIMTAMLVTVGIFVIANMPKLLEKYGEAYQTPAANGILPTLFNPDGQGYGLYASFCLSNIVFWGLWWPGSMDQWQRCAAGRAKSLGVHRMWGTVGRIPIVWFGVLTFLFLGAGALIKVNFPKDQPSPDFLRLVVSQVHTWGSGQFGMLAGAALAAITLWGLICAAMSTIDGYVMTTSQSFFLDTLNYSRGSLVSLSADDTATDASDTGGAAEPSGATGTGAIETKGANVTTQATAAVGSQGSVGSAGVTGAGQLLKAARGATILVPLIVCVLSVVFSLATDVYALIYFSFSFMFALIPPLFVGLMGWAHPGAARASERSLFAGGVTNLVGYLIFILPGLERALAGGNAGSILGWYQAVYWWPVVVSLVGAFVLWVSWSKRIPQAVGGA